MTKNIPAILSAVLGVVIVVLFVAYVIQAQQEQELLEKHDTELGSDRIALGVIGKPPARGDIPKIDGVPWKLSQISRSYNDARDRICEMLGSGVPIRSLNQTTQPKTGGFIGRLPIFTIGLRIDPAAAKDMPRTTKTEIERYLRDHIIVMELMLYHDENGAPFMGVDCQAGVCNVADPRQTVAAEPLITEAIRQVRMLGILENEQTADGETLLTAFRYTRSSGDAAYSVSQSKYETELFFTHLSKDSTAENPKISVYATSGDRETLHHLNEETLNDFSGTPSITVDIRFDDFEMMGLYPSKPVVTGVHPNTGKQLSTEVILRLMSENEDWDFSRLLEKFDSLL